MWNWAAGLPKMKCWALLKMEASELLPCGIKQLSQLWSLQSSFDCFRPSNLEAAMFLTRILQLHIALDLTEPLTPFSRLNLYPAW